MFVAGQPFIVHVKRVVGILNVVWNSVDILPRLRKTTPEAYDGQGVTNV